MHLGARTTIKKGNSRIQFVLGRKYVKTVLPKSTKSPKANKDTEARM